MILKNIRELREAAGLSPADLASKAVCSEKTVNNIEKGISTTFNTAKRIASALKVKITDIRSEL